MLVRQPRHLTTETTCVARQARIVVPGQPHHVYLRGNNRRRLFSHAADYERFLACLVLGVDASECALHQLTLMSNHVHLIATPPVASGLSRLLHRTCQRYAQVRNLLRDSSGKLFEERFHSKPILDDEYLCTVTIYNDVNAFRAGRVRTPLAHVWSTGPLHAGRASRIPARLWTPSSWYLGLGATPQARAARYRELVAGRLDEPDEVIPTRPYQRRLERPNRTSAREESPRWGDIPVSLQRVGSTDPVPKSRRPG